MTRMPINLAYYVFEIIYMDEQLEDLFAKFGRIIEAINFLSY